MEVVILERGLGPDFSGDFGKGSQDLKDDTVGFDTPVIQLSEESFGYATAIESRDKFDIEDLDLESISGNLFVSTVSSGRIFIDRKGSRELEFI